MIKLSSKILKIYNHRTSMRLTVQEWNALNDICETEKITRNRLVEMIYDAKDAQMGLTYSTRIFALLYYKYNFTQPSPQNIITTLKNLA